MVALTKHWLPVTLRPLVRREINQVIALGPHMLGARWRRKELEYFIRGRHNHAAHFDNRVVGCLLYDSPAPTWLHIAHLIIAKKYRRCGIGTRLIENLINMLSADSWSHITMLVGETDLAMQLLLHSHGFHRGNPWSRWQIRPNMNAYIMQHDLGGPSDHALISQEIGMRPGIPRVTV